MQELPDASAPEVEQHDTTLDQIIREPEEAPPEEPAEEPVASEEPTEPAEEKQHSDPSFTKAVEEKVNKRISRERRRHAEQMGAVNQQLLEIRAQLADNYSHVSSAPPQHGETAPFGGTVEDMAAAFLKAQQIAQQQSSQTQQYEQQQRQEYQQKIQDAEFVQRYDDEYEDAKEDIADLDEVINGVAPYLTSSMMEAIKRTGPKAFYAVAKNNLPEIQRILSIGSPIDQYDEFRDLLRSAKSPSTQQAPKPIKAVPAPIRQERPSGSTRPVSSDTIDFMRKTLAGR